MTVALRLDPDAPAWAAGWAARAGLELGSVGVLVRFLVDPSIPDRPRGPHAVGTRADEFVLHVQGDPFAPSALEVRGRTPAALRRASVAVARVLDGEGWTGGTTTQGPAFAVRGLLEGFYGPPWSHDARLRMIDDAADLGLTHVFVAPKDEEGQRQHWSEPLAADATARLAELVSRAEREQVRLMCAVSPGLSIVWSSDEHLEALVARFRQLHDIGVRDAALFLDDIPATLASPADRAAYPDVATAHADLAARWARRLWQDDPSWRLAVCPMEYHGRGDEAYLETIAASLPAPVDLMWTGREICSRTLDLMDGATFWRATGRPPLWWDNYPVNDLAMRDRLHIGPLIGRDRHLHRVSAGLFANAMDLAECTRIPLATIADYLWDPEGYDAESSWERSLRRVAGDAWQEVRELADNVRSSCLPDDESPRLAAVLLEAAMARRAGDLDGSRALLADAAARIDDVASLLRTSHLANERLRTEIAPWVEAYARGADDLRAAASVTGTGDAVARRSVLERRRLVGFHGAQVFGDVLDAFLTDLVDDPAQT